jgi:hypothetical protein
MKKDILLQFSPTSIHFFPIPVGTKHICLRLLLVYFKVSQSHEDPEAPEGTLAKDGKAATQKKKKKMQEEQKLAQFSNLEHFIKHPKDNFPPRNEPKKI